MPEAEVNKEELQAKIAELEQTVRVLKEDLIHDSLTGLKTRAFFNGEAKIFFDTVVDQHRNTRKEWFGLKNISFIFIDIDHFKSINDTYGHFAGDGVLKSVARCIEDSVRKGDIAARWGGEEMVVALMGSTEKNAKIKAESIRKNVERLSFNAVHGLNVTVSSGVASAEEGTSFEEILNRADKALYEAKETGRNKVVAWSDMRSNG